MTKLQFQQTRAARRRISGARARGEKGAGAPDLLRCRRPPAAPPTPRHRPSTIARAMSRCRRLVSKVNLTGGNQSGLTGYRSNRSGPVPVSAGTQPAKIQILNLNLKNEKFLKILQGVMNLMVSNFLKNSFIEYSLWEFKVKSKKKKKWAGP